MKVTLTTEYLNNDKRAFNRYIITEGMTPDMEFKVSQQIGDLVMIPAKELGKHAKPEHRHLWEWEGSSDYPFLRGEYKKVSPFAFWNKLKSGKLFK